MIFTFQHLPFTLPPIAEITPETGLEAGSIAAW